MNEVRFINLEYIFSKIYDFLIYVKNIIIGRGDLNVASGGTDYAGIIHNISSVILTILSILTIVFIIWAIYLRIRIFEIDEQLDGSYKEHFIKPVATEARRNERWETIVRHFASPNPNDWRAAIIDADNMLEELITSLGYSGETFGEKLKGINLHDFPTLNSAWEAHKVRNLVAHEGINYNLTERQKDITRRHFETVFRDAGVI